MDRGPLVSEEIESGAEMAREFDKLIPVKIAFWLKSSEKEFRYLYLASERIDATNRHEAYEQLVRLANKMQSPHLNLFRMRLISAEHPLAKAAVEIKDRFPSRTGTRLGGTSFGGISVDDVYIYPSPLPATVP